MMFFPLNKLNAECRSCFFYTVKVYGEPIVSSSKKDEKPFEHYKSIVHMTHTLYFKHLNSVVFVN